MAEAQQPTIVTLRFDRQLSDSEIEALKQTTDAIEAQADGGEHHDHDHKQEQVVQLAE
jgi:hypothetical protein